MTSKFNHVYDLSYSIADDGEELVLEQSLGSPEEKCRVKLHRLHIKLLAEKMKINEPSPSTMDEIVRIELLELLDELEEYWSDYGSNRGMDLHLLQQVKAIYKKCFSVCRIAGCNVDEKLNEDSKLNEASNLQLPLLEGHL